MYILLQNANELETQGMLICTHFTQSRNHHVSSPSNADMFWKILSSSGVIAGLFSKVTNLHYERKEEEGGEGGRGKEGKQIKKTENRLKNTPSINLMID